MAVQLGNMDTESQRPSPSLAKGQLWQTDSAYFQILGLEDELIHYKVMKQPDQPAVTRLIRMDLLAVHLRAARASLIN